MCLAGALSETDWTLTDWLVLERSYVSVRAAKPDDARNFYASVVKSLPAKMAEEARQESVRIIGDCSRPRDNLTGR